MSERRLEVLQVIIGFLAFMEIGNTLDKTEGAIIMAVSALVFMFWLCARDSSQYRELWLFYTICMCLVALLNHPQLIWVIITILFIIVRVIHEYLKRKGVFSRRYV